MENRKSFCEKFKENFTKLAHNIYGIYFARVKIIDGNSEDEEELLKQEKEEREKIENTIPYGGA